MNESEMKHGSPIFYELLEEMAKTHDKKSHDYASNENPYGNYYFAGKITLLFSHSEQDAGFIGRLAEKIYRLANLENSKKIARNESIEDTEIDILIITCLWMASRRELRRSNLTKTNEKYATASHPPTESQLAQINMIESTEKLTDEAIDDMITYLIEMKKFRKRNEKMNVNQ